MGFKLTVISQVEKGEQTYKQAQNFTEYKGIVLVWLRKHDALDWSKPILHMKQKSKEIPSQKIKRLEKELSDERLKNEILNRMIDLLVFF